ncbi:hypothetical protein WJX82_008853 [Trebouxia sp. C0006]
MPERRESGSKTQQDLAVGSQDFGLPLRPSPRNLEQAVWMGSVEGQRIFTQLLGGETADYIGAVRVFGIAEKVLFEQLTKLDNQEMIMAWQLMTHPMNSNPWPAAFVNFKASIQVFPVSIPGNQSFLEWRMELLTEQHAAAHMTNAMNDIMAVGLSNLGKYMNRSTSNSGGSSSGSGLAGGIVGSSVAPPAYGIPFMEQPHSVPTQSAPISQAMSTASLTGNSALLQQPTFVPAPGQTLSSATMSQQPAAAMGGFAQQPVHAPIYWVGVWPMPRVLAAGVHPVLRQPNDPKRAKLSVAETPFSQVANFMSLPDPLLEQILQVLPTKDRLLHVPLVCTHMANLSSHPVAVWEEVVIDAAVIGTSLKLDLLESWLSIRGAGVKSLKIESWKVWSENSDDGEISPRTSGIIPNVFMLCKVSLQSLTITDCGSIFAEADFAALAELSLIQKLHIQTDVQVRPQAISQLSCLTLLNSLSLTVEPGDRLNLLDYQEFSGFPHAVVSLTALTSLTLSGWTFIGDLPESIGMLTALHELLLPNCVATRLLASLQKLTDLERLDFCSNALGRPVAVDPPNCLLNAHKLTSIRLSGNFYSALETVDCGDNLPLQVDQYLVIWGLIKQLPRLQHLFIDKPTEDDGDDDVLNWSKESLQQIASLKKIMKKRKRRETRIIRAPLTQSSLAALPSEILAFVFRHLYNSPEAAISLAQTCQSLASEFLAHRSDAVGHHIDVWWSRDSTLRQIYALSEQPGAIEKMWDAGFSDVRKHLHWKGHRSEPWPMCDKLDEEFDLAETDTVDSYISWDDRFNPEAERLPCSQQLLAITGSWYRGESGQKGEVCGDKVIDCPKLDKNFCEWQSWDKDVWMFEPFSCEMASEPRWYYT